MKGNNNAWLHAQVSKSKSGLLESREQKAATQYKVITSKVQNNFAKEAVEESTR